MTATEIAEALAERVAREGREAQVYLFGSALRPQAVWSDIDILIVCPRADDAAPLRAAVSDLCLIYPIDLTIMSRAEEAEFGFVDGEGCRAIDPGSSAQARTRAPWPTGRDHDGDLRKENWCRT